MAPRRIRDSVVFHHDGKDGDQLVNTAVASNKNAKTLTILLLIIAAMVVLVALTPKLYRAFCEATGFDGTTQRATQAPGAVPGQVKVEFDANVHPGLPWRFEPEQNEVNIAPGAKTKIFYSAQNLSARTIVGQAVYNVSPDTVGKYFKKIQCFCFSEQTLKPGEKVDMPVIFFVDPAIKKDPDTKDVHEITLSYTFYPVETVTASR
jgi:cytochrome c oxidase assembly protein subunit 11